MKNWKHLDAFLNNCLNRGKIGQKRVDFEKVRVSKKGDSVAKCQGKGNFTISTKIWNLEFGIWNKKSKRIHIVMHDQLLEFGELLHGVQDFLQDLAGLVDGGAGFYF